MASRDERHSVTTMRFTPASSSASTSARVIEGEPFTVTSNGSPERPYCSRSSVSLAMCSRALSGVCRSAYQPSPRRAARRRAAGVSPPTRMGGCGF